MTETAYQAIPEVSADEVKPHAGTVVMKFGGTSVAGPERLKAVAQRLVGAHEAGNRVVGVLSAMGDTTDELLELAHEITDAPGPARARHAHLGRRADLVRARGDGDLSTSATRRSRSPARRPGIVTDTVHGKAQDRRGPRAADPRGARRGRDRPRRRVPGRLERVARRHDARPRRLRHDRRRARRRARRRLLRDLHRRRRRLHRRSAHRPGRAEAPRGQLRRDARDGRCAARRFCSYARSSSRETTT